MTETNLLRSVLLALTQRVKNARLFRNNVGQGWAGRCISLGQKIIVHDPHPLQAGLCAGSSDLIGWTTTTITPEMIGINVAVFTAIEVKTTTGRVSDAQRIFLENVRAAGGIARVVRSDAEAVAALTLPLHQQIKGL